MINYFRRQLKILTSSMQKRQFRFILLPLGALYALVGLAPRAVYALGLTQDEDGDVVSTASVALKWFTNFFSRKATDWFENTVWSSFSGLVTGIAGLVQAVGNFLMDWLGNICQVLINSTLTTGGEDDKLSILTNPVIKGAFDEMLGIANTLFLIAILIFAVMIILRQTGYNFKKAITSLVLVAALANFSRIIVLVFVEASTMLSTMLNKMGENEDPATFFKTMGQSFNSFSGDQYWQVVKGINEAGGFTDGLPHLAAILAMTVVLCIGVYVFYKIAFLLVERAVRLTIYMIFGPLVFALSLFPAKELQELSSKWWTEVLKWSMVLPAAVFLIQISYIFLNLVDETMKKQGIILGLGILNAEGELAGASGESALMISQAGTGTGASPVEIVSYLILFTISVVLLLAAANVSGTMGIAATKITDGAQSLVSGGLRKIRSGAFATAKWAGRGIGKGAKHATYMALKRSSRLKRVVGGVYGAFKGRSALLEEQAEQRKLFFGEMAGQGVRGRYLNAHQAKETESRAILNKEATDRYKVKTTKDKDAFAQLGYDQKEIVEKATKDTRGNTKKAHNLEVIETAYMRVLADDVKREYDLGKTPDETQGAIDAARKKVRGSKGADREAAHKLNTLIAVQKQQAMKLQGEPRQMATRYRNQNMDDKGLMTMLDTQTGFPPKFGLTKVTPKGAPRATTANDYAQLAVSTAQLQEAEQKLQDLQKAMSELPAVTIAIQGMSTASLEQAMDPKVGTLLAQPGVRSGAAQVQHLSQQEKEKIARIQGTASIPTAQKNNLIQDVLRKNPRTASTAAPVGEALARGIAVDEFENAQTLAGVIHQQTGHLRGPAAQNAQEKKVKARQIAAVATQHRQASDKHQRIQGVVTTTTVPHPGYQDAVRKRGDSYTQTEIPKLKTDLLTAVGASGDTQAVEDNMNRPTKSIGEVTKELQTRLQDMSKHFGLPNLVHEDSTLQEQIEILENLEAASKPQNPIPPEEE